MKIKQVGTVLAPLSLFGMLTLTGCGDPCAGLKATERDQTVFENGGEVEREGKRGVECEASERTGGEFVED